MKPLPSADIPGQSASPAMPSLPDGPAVTLPVTPGPYSTANRRAASCPTQKLYPWLLAASTTVAAVFCLMYITKPVLRTSPAAATADTAAANPAAEPTQALSSGTPPASLLPGSKHLPGESPLVAGPAGPADDPRRSLPSSQTAFEETNLRIQHVLTAETPGGDLTRLVLDVPVLYQSRQLRWTPSEVAEARELLDRLQTYQDQSRQLREEGTTLLESWNALVERSIPNADLRADSPSLPENEIGSAAVIRPDGLDTSGAIQLQTDGQ